MTEKEKKIQKALGFKFTVCHQCKKEVLKDHKYWTAKFSGLYYYCFSCWGEYLKACKLYRDIISGRLNTK